MVYAISDIDFSKWLSMKKMLFKIEQNKNGHGKTKKPGTPKKGGKDREITR